MDQSGRCPFQTTRGSRHRPGRATPGSVPATATTPLSVSSVLISANRAPATGESGVADEPELFVAKRQNGRVMETIEIDGLRIAFDRVGVGPALILLHGYVGDGRTTWRRQIEGLCDSFTVVTWDAPGVGGSSDPPETFGMAGYADVLADFVAGVGLENPHVVGLSFGGALALEFARRHPALPRSLVLASAYAGWGGSLPAPVAEQRLRQALTLSNLTPDEYTAALLPTMFSDGTAAETVEEFGSAMRAFRPAGFRAMSHACAEDLRDSLAQVRVPTLLIYGDKDVRAPMTVARQLQEAISGSSLVVLPDVGHVCNIEAAAEFNAAVRGFLLAQGGGPPS